MKILLVNYHYFIHGGPDRYFFNVKAALESVGHTVIPFAFDYDATFETSYRKYFPEPITGKGPYLLSQISLSTKAKIKAACRMFLNHEVDSKFRAIIEEEKPDVVYSVFLADSMLPNILKIAKKEYGVTVIYRLSDFHMFCASHLFFRDGNVCTECLTKKWSAVKYKCVKQSRLASAFRVLQMKYIKCRKWYDYADTFICPSELMANYLIKAGVSRHKVKHIPTFTQEFTHSPDDLLEGYPYLLYFGRINQEKGTEILIHAFNNIKKPKFHLKMVGYVDPAYKNVLYDYLDVSHRALVDIIPPLQGHKLEAMIRKSLLVVHPAICFDNMPNSVLEALSAGKPVIASNLGSLPEIVQDGLNGRLFEPANHLQLAKCILEMTSDENLLQRMGDASRELYEQKYTQRAHMQKLMEVFNEVWHDDL